MAKSINFNTDGKNVKARTKWLWFRRCGFFLLSFLIILQTTQAIFFLRVFSQPRHLEPADLIVSFEGTEERAHTAYQLADLNYAPAVAISPANKNKLALYDRRFQPKRHFQKIMETQARTTFENALYTSRIIRKHKFKSVILVTSWNHIPRSKFLLRLMLIGAGTRILTDPVRTGMLDNENWYRHTIGWKMVYNEMVESWGSLIEYAQYILSGKMPDVQTGKFRLMRTMKNYLLFDIRAKALTCKSN